MKYLQNLHQHTSFCDGKDTPEEVVLAAISRGFDSIGFSSHSPTPFPEDYNLTDDKVADYIAEINRLKEKYKDKIAIHLGIELDSESTMDLAPYDYIISSSHYVHCPDGTRYSVDHSVKTAQEACGKFPTPLDYAKNYYERLSALPKPDKSTFVAHFDLVTKYQQRTPLFDENSHKYRSYAIDCLHTLAKNFSLFEINTGVISRGYRDYPYPAGFILEEMRALNLGVVISSDCHDKNKLDCAFDQAKIILRKHGFNCHYIFKDKDFIPIPLD